MFICAPMCIWDLLRHTNCFKIAVKKKAEWTWRQVMRGQSG